MTHHEIEQQEIIERYARGELAEDERRAFQEHFFTCDACFKQVQMTYRFIAGVRHAAREGILARGLPGSSEAKAFPSWLAWLRPAFLISATASLLMALALAWLALYKMPSMRVELARERQSRQQAEQEGRQSLDSALKQLESEKQERARLESELQQRAQANANRQVAPLAEAQPNVPLVMLEATREAAANELVVPARVRSFVLWLEVEPGARFNSFRLQVYTASGQLVRTVDGLRRNAYGALAVSLAAAPFQPGKYTVKLYGVDKQQATLLGEYRLQIRAR